MTKTRPAKPRPKKAVGAESAKAADLKRLTQQQAAWLIGDSPIWLRDNGHLFDRNQDGSYSARELVRVVRSRFKAVELPDSDLEPVRQLAGSFADWHGSSLPAVLQILDSIERRYGAPGLAAVGKVFLEEVRSQAKWWADRPSRSKPTPAEILADAERAVAERDAHEELRTLIVCDECRAYRWGRTWKKPPLPKGYVGLVGGPCSKCE